MKEEKDATIDSITSLGITADVGYKFNTNDLNGLVKFLRNVYEHYYQNLLSIKFFYEEVQRL